MIMHSPRSRPAPWPIRKPGTARKWLTPFIAFEWMWEWAAFYLSNWSFLAVLEYLGTFSVLVAVIFYFSESGDRIKQRWRGVEIEHAWMLHITQHSHAIGAVFLDVHSDGEIRVVG